MRSNGTPWFVTGASLLAGALLATAGCHPSGKDEVSSATSALSSPSAASILGFEATSSWNAGSFQLSSNNKHTQGAHSLAIAAKGYDPITSVALPPPITVGSSVSFDLLLPTAQANPSWYGAVQVYFNSPSSNLYNAYLGQVELTGFPTNTFETVRLPVPQQILASIRPQATDFTVTITLNVPTNSTGTYLLDNLVLAAKVSSCNQAYIGFACDDGNPCTNSDVCTASGCVGQAIPACTGTSPSQPITVSLGTTPLAVNAYFPTCNNTDSTVATASMTSFTIPSTVAVSSAAAATVVLQVSGLALPAMQCTYTAPATSTRQTKQATFTSCSDGSAAGKAVHATTFTLSITSAPGVHTPGDGVCADSAVSATVPLGVAGMPLLPEPISATDTTSIRQSFSWANTTPVTELDSQGRALLYYALIYVEHRNQVAYLDQLQIHHDFYPVLDGMPSWRGRRGVFAHHGDGKGVFSFAILTGSQYNFIRSHALSDAVLFNAVVLRTPPAAFANPDGLTISYRALANAAFRYRGIDPVVAAQQPPVAPILCAIDVGGVVKSVVQAGADLYHDAGNLISSWIGDAASIVTDTENIKISVSLLNTDPTFNLPTRVNFDSLNQQSPITNNLGFDYTPFIRAWGEFGGAPIYPKGITIEIRGAIIPMYQSATADDTGSASLTFNKGLDTNICLLLQNYAGQVIDEITTAELCDGTAYNTDSIHAPINFKIASDYTNVLAQLMENNSYATDVMGFTPSAPQVLVGQYADLMPNPITPCLTMFNPEASLTFTTTIIRDVALVEAALEDQTKVLTLEEVGDCIYEVDMVMPSEGGWAASRGVTSHESGHWDMCTLIGTGGLASGYDEAIFESLIPIAESLGECNEQCGNEGFADFIAGQIAGGTNYYGFHDSIGDIGTTAVNGGILQRAGSLMKYCPSTSNTCLDENINGSGQLSQLVNNTNTNVATFTSTIQDFVDISADQRDDTVPQNGNYWSDNISKANVIDTLTLNRVIGGSQGDESINLSGAAVAAAIRNRRGSGIDGDAIYGGLADQATAAGYNWCQLCRLFALHRPGVCDPTPGSDCTLTMADSDFINFCTGDPLITRWIGAPPSFSDPESCAFQPASSCPAGQIISNIGTCITPPCPNGQVLNGFSGECVDTCPPQTVRGKQVVPPVVNGVCQVIIG